MNPTSIVGHAGRSSFATIPGVLLASLVLTLAACGGGDESTARSTAAGVGGASAAVAVSLEPRGANSLRAAAR